jgi:hypothetical protein
MERAIIAHETVAKDTLLCVATYLIHKDEPYDKYEAYLVSDLKPAKRGRNPLNLFDDINHLDRKYVRAVRQFIRTRGISLPTRKDK